MARFNLDSISYNPLSARSKQAVDYAMNILDARLWENRSPNPTPNSRTSTKRKGTTYRKRNKPKIANPLPKSVGEPSKGASDSSKSRIEVSNESGYERARAHAMQLLREREAKKQRAASTSQSVTPSSQANANTPSKEPTNSKYVNYYTKGDEGVLPDLVVTPTKVDFLRDSRGNYARTVEDLEIAKGGRNFNVYYDKTLNKNLQQETPRQKSKRERGLGDDFENLMGALISGNYTNVARSSADNFRRGNYIRGAVQAAYPLNFVGGPIGALTNAATSAEFLSGEEGVKKTYNLARQGEYGRAAVSAAGDVLALLAGGRGAYVAGKPVVNYLDRQPIVGNVLEHTPVGRSKASLSTNRAYRVTNMSEVEDLGRTGVFREQPGTTPIDEITSAQRAELPAGQYTNPNASYGHGSKYFVKGNLPEVKGHRVHSKGGEEVVISVPGRNTKWHVGHGGHTLVREVKNGKVIFKKNDVVGKPEYTWNEIPTGKAIHKRFTLGYRGKEGAEQVVEGIGRRGAKAYRTTERNRMRRIPIANSKAKVSNPVSMTGKVSANRLLKFYHQIDKLYPTSRGFGIKNKGYNKLGQRTRTNLIEHTNGVIRSAQTAPLPKGVTRKQFVEAALVHDLGKLFNPTRTHGQTSNWLASQMGIRLNSAQRAAIAKHMDFLENTSANTSLENALHTADIARGLPYSTIVNRYNYLRY